MIRAISRPSILGLLLTLLALASSASAVEETPDLGSEEKRLLARMAAEGTNSVALYALADHCHDLGVDGDQKAVIRAEEYLRQLLDLEPTNARALALLGSVYTMKGRDAFWPTTQLRFVREGNSFMDQAVRLAPDSVPTRLIRALNNAHMPDFLGRADIVRSDLEWLWPRIEADPEKFTQSSRQNAALHWGRLLKKQRRMEEARRVWQLGSSFDPETKAGREITSELARLR